MSTKILITGGLGHIGSYLINNLPAAYDVTAVDNMLTNKYNSLFELTRNINFINCDFIDIPIDILESTDIILHLAAITDAANPNNHDEIETINVGLTKLFIDKCAKHSNAKFIFPSSTSVYGVSSKYVTEDDDKFINPQSRYAESKIKIENYLKKSDVNYTILRLGTIFGVSWGMRFHTAVNKFCYQAALGLPLTVWKQNYDQYRPYLGLSDCRDGILQTINNKSERQVFNLITNNYKLDHIVELINSVKKVNLNMVDTPLLNQHSYKVDTSKIKRLGYHPRSNIYSEIKKTIALFDSVN
jgi:nucleoside-diphosphate-sugar epimerase